MADVGHLERLGAAILPAGGEGNAVVSPFNVAAALALLVPGARGEAAAALASVLGPDPVAAVKATVAQMKELEETEAVGPTAAWIRPGFDIKPEYRRAIVDELAAEVSELDFGDTERAAAEINRWVAAATGERVSDLVSSRDFHPDLTRLVVTAALFFKAAWIKPLERIGQRPFRLAGSEVAQREFMAGRSRFPHAEGPGWEALRLDYGDGVTGLEIVAPHDLEAFERDLPANLAGVRAALAPAEVELELPLFALRRHAELSDALAGAGLGALFAETGAVLGGITDSEELFVSAVIHEALVEVDENGTLAAAATAIVLRASGAYEPAEPKRMTVDRPFLFVLRGPESVPLFVGRVADPKPPPLR